MRHIVAVSKRRQVSAEKAICHRSHDTITQLPEPSGFGSDPFTDALREGARKLIAQASHAEPVALMATFSGEKLEDGRARPATARWGQTDRHALLKRRQDPSIRNSTRFVRWSAEVTRKKEAAPKDDLSLASLTV